MALKSVHFILSYMCNYQCDHCFLFCRPSSMGTFTIDLIRGVINDCRNINTVDSVSFEGGEPFLFYPLLLESVKLAVKAGYTTSVVSNCYWATSESDAEMWLKPLAEAGLSTLEISDDAFHSGDGDNLQVNQAEMAARNIGLDTYKIKIVMPPYEGDGPQEKGTPIYIGYPKIRGRAVEKISPHMISQSWDIFTECPLEMLQNPSRIHIDPFGNVHLCQGLLMGNVERHPLSVMLKGYDPYVHPIVGPLLEGGPARLIEAYGLNPQQKCVDACHLCSLACAALLDRFSSYLGPKQIYGL